MTTDKDEVPASSPGRPTTHRRRSQRCRQRAGHARRQLGLRWGRTPIPAGTSTGPSGTAHPGVRLGDDHPPWSHTQPRTPATRPVRPPRAAACTRAHRAACSRAHRAAARERRSPRRPGLPGHSAGKRGRRSPQPQPGGPVGHRPPPDQRDLGQRRSRPGLRDRRSSPSTARQPPGPPQVPVVRVARPARPWSHCHRLSMGGDERVRTDGWTPDGWTPHGRTADGWTADSRPPDPLDDDPR
jgi:hypothetical protein